MSTIIKHVRLACGAMIAVALLTMIPARTASAATATVVAPAHSAHCGSGNGCVHETISSAVANSAKGSIDWDQVAADIATCEAGVSVDSLGCGLHAIGSSVWGAFQSLFTR